MIDAQFSKDFLDTHLLNFPLDAYGGLVVAGWGVDNPGG